MFKRLVQIWQSILRFFGFSKTSSTPVPPPVATSTATPPPTEPTAPQQPAPLVEPELPLPATEPPIYQKWDYLLTYRERVFFSALLDALQWDYWAFAKVRMADVIRLANEPADRKFHTNQILCKHLDFVLCTKKTYRPVLVIELDDSSHLHPDRQARDAFKNNTLAQAGLPLLRVELQKFYNPETLREDILAMLEKNPTEESE